MMDNDNVIELDVMVVTPDDLEETNEWDEEEWQSRIDNDDAERDEIDDLDYDSHNNSNKKTSRVKMAGTAILTIPAGNSLNITIGTQAIKKGFADLNAALFRYAGILGRFAATAVSATGGILIGALWPSSTASGEFERKVIEEARARSRAKKAELTGATEVWSVSTLPAKQITTASTQQIREQHAVIAEVIAQPVINVKNQQRQTVFTRNATKVTVVKAEKTDKPNVYTAQIVSGMKPMQISVDSSVRSSPKNEASAHSTAVAGVSSSAIIADTHHAIIDFDGEHDPIYISVSKIPTVEEENAQLEEAKKLDQKWKIDNPLAAIELELFEAQNEIEKIINGPHKEKLNYLNQLINSPEGLALIDPVKNPLIFQRHKKEENSDFSKKNRIFDLEIIINSRELVDAALKHPETKDFENAVLKIKPKNLNGFQSFAFLGGYFTLSGELEDIKNKIEQTKKELSSVLENKNKAENKKKEAEQKLYSLGLKTRTELESIASQNSSIPTPIRHRFINDPETGELNQGVYRTIQENGINQVPVRYMTYNSSLNRYEFSIDGEVNKPSIIWTPDNPGFQFPNNTGNHIPLNISGTSLITPIPEPTGIDIEVYPMPEPRGLTDYILITPVPDIPPIYVYFKKPVVKFLEVESYDDFEGRPRDGYHADHMPSAAAVKLHLKRLNPELKTDELSKRAKQVASIIIPADVHRKLSETYGGRNKARMEEDSKDLEAAVNRNFDAIKGELKNHGATEEQLKSAHDRIHEINRKFKLY